ncbi:MAG: glycosyltransferase [Bacteroidetes bacterium]|nr:MAG: glycosyltransferase [Bacteroidota bacterium]
MLQFRVPSWVNKHQFEYENADELSNSVVSTIVFGMKKLNSNNSIASIVIPVWNEEKNIARTLSSLAAQKTDYSFEVIVVNNNSTDGTQAVLDRCGVQSFFEPRQGIPWARQAGLEKARGKYILCADGDSLYPENWVETLVQSLEQPDVAVVYGRHSFIPPKNSSRISIAIYEWFAEISFKIRGRKKLHLNAMAASLGFRRDWALEVGGFDPAMKRGSDGRLTFHLAQKGGITVLHEDDARVWTDSRRLFTNGGLVKAFVSRAWKEIKRFKEYV